MNTTSDSGLPQEFKWSEPIHDRLYQQKLYESQKKRISLLTSQHENLDAHLLGQELEKVRRLLTQTISEKQAVDSELRRTSEELKKYKNEMVVVQRELDIAVRKNENSNIHNTAQSVKPAPTGTVSKTSTSSKLDPTTAQGIIEAIRTEKQLDFPNRSALCGCIDNLGGNLYPSPSHFVQELIQNSDDCEYEPGTCAQLSISFSPTGFLFSSNEVGFEEKNVRAICSISESSKHTGGAANTGEKGLGFKSVFEVTHKPHIISRDFSFFFDSIEGKDSIEKYLLPHW